MPENEEKSLDRLDREIAAELPIGTLDRAEHGKRTVDVFKNQPEVMARTVPRAAAPMPGAPAQVQSTTVAPTPGYEELQRILQHAYSQASTGKGAQRHANSFIGRLPWHEQPIMSLTRQVGPGGSAYQVAKKAQEAIGMIGRGDFVAAKAEALGAIVYAASLVKLIEEMEASATTKA